MADGGGGGGTSTTVQELSKEQKAILGLATPIFQNYFKGGFSGLQDKVFPGKNTIADQSANEKLGASILRSQALGPLQTSANSMLSGMNFMTSGKVLDPNTNPGLKGTIDAAVRPLTEQYSQTIMPEVRGDMLLSGGYGSNRQGIETGMASNNLMRAIGDTSSNIAFQGYNTGLESMQRSLAFAPGVMQAAQLPGQTVSAIGAQQRQFNQNNIDENMQNWYNKQFFPLMLAQQIAGTAFGYPGGSTLTKTSGGGGASPLQGAIGGAAIGTSIMPGWGTAAGAGIGALLGLF